MSCTPTRKSTMISAIVCKIGGLAKQSMARCRGSGGSIPTPAATLLLWRAIVISLYLATSTVALDERRNLSEIRYHFTPCGATGRLGPTHEQCLRYYTSAGSPIARDGVLTDTYASSYPGSQSFRPPRRTAWNLTIAGAAGGRGLCNIHRGRGLVQRQTRVDLGNERDILVVAGQRGLGPCDTPNPNGLGHSLCESPPRNLSETIDCDSTYFDWLDALPVPNALFSGGAGGGGVSFVGTRTYSSSLFGEIVGMSGGGGGTPPVMFYSTLGAGEFNLSTPALYQEFIDAKQNISDKSISRFVGSTGSRVMDSVIAGAGGGYSEFIYVGFPQLSQSDGRALNMSQSFAEGGLHCLGDLVTVPEQFKVAVGGFGGGGGGCINGGGGGGFTGGGVVNNFYTPGSGGFSLPGFLWSYNSGDGYVDIVAADCGCVFQCMVYEEEDKFQCHCPDSTQLAPDLSDCFQSVERNISEPSAVIGDAGESDFTLQVVGFGNSSYVYSVDVGLSVDPVGVERDGGPLCVLLFAGEDDEIVLVTEPISGSGRASSLSQIVTHGGYLTATNYTVFLDSPSLVTGAVLATTGSCTIDDVINFNISIRDTEDQGGANFTQILTDLYNKSSSANSLLLRLLNLPEAEEEEDESSSLSGGVIAAIVIAAVLVTGAVIVCLTLPPVLLAKRREKSNGIFLREENGREETVALDYVRYTGQTRLSEDLQTNVGYETLNFGDNDGVVETVPGGEVFVSKYGVNTTVFDFTEFNRSRADTGMNDWEYPRSKLNFMRDLGEGQFGKVMLMKAMGIAGYSNDIPVAVKTLSSRDPDVIQKFMDETDLMKKFSHPNIVSLLGVCNMSVKDDSAPLMILEYMPYGDLQGFLDTHRPTEENPVSQISEDHFYSFALDVVKALDFLSSRKYVHRDIAARNCLVGANLLIKIADFGLARGVYDKDYYRVAGSTFLPVRWMAPESLMYGVFSTASDVWAYGVLLWEITSYGSTPLVGCDPQEVVNMAQNGSLRHSKPESCPEEMYNLMCLCHILNHEDRPSFSDLLPLLETATHDGKRTSNDD